MGIRIARVKWPASEGPECSGRKTGGGVDGDASRSAPGTIPPKADGIWVGDVGVEGEIEFIQANGVEGGEWGGEVLKCHVKGVTSPKSVMSVLSERGGEMVSRSGWMGD